MDYPVFVVPGIGNSGPAHWQSRWQAAHPDWRRMEIPDWDDVECGEWVEAIERQIGALGEGTVIVAHSLGCLAVAHWAARHAPKIRGALLVAVPDPTAAAFPASSARGFTPLPDERLPFPSVIVASTDDPYGSADYARARAKAWGSEFVDAGARGHLNGESGLGDWDQGMRLLRALTYR